MHFHLNADLLQRQNRRRPDVLELIHRRDRKVALFVTRLVSEVRALRRSLFSCVPESRLGVEIVETVVVALIETHVVEKEKFELGADVNDVREARFLQVRLRLLGNVPRIARVHLGCDRVLHIAGQDHRRLGRERIHHRRVGIGNQKHVRFMNALISPDRGAVETDSLLEKILAQLADWN